VADAVAVYVVLFCHPPGAVQLTLPPELDRAVDPPTAGVDRLVAAPVADPEPVTSHAADAVPAMRTTEVTVAARPAIARVLIPLLPIVRSVDGPVARLSVMTDL
jgi:hypothetical protein